MKHLNSISFIELVYQQSKTYLNLINLELLKV